MSKYIVDSSLMTGIADNIRLKTGKQENLVFPSGFNTAIESLPSIEDMRDIKDKVDDIKDIFDSNETEIDKTITTPTDIASFSDGADDISMALKIDIEPVQDLHGYDNPWPAGGGKNLADTRNISGTIAGITFTSDANGIITLTGTRDSSTGWKPIISFTNFEPGDYIFSTNNSHLTCLLNYTQKPSIFTFAEGNTVRIALNIPEGETVSETIKVQIEKGSTASAWSPYENICLISGWDSANVWDDPAYDGLITWNQIIKQDYSFGSPHTHNGITYTRNADGSITVSGTVAGYINSYCQISNNVDIKAGHKYYISSGSNNVLIWYNGTGGINPIPEGIGIISTITSGFYLRVNGEGTQVNVTVNPQVFDLTEMFGAGNEPSTVAEVRSLFPKAYYPYNTGEVTTVSAVNGDPYRHIEVQFPSEAGTVYGGELTVNKDGSGTLVVDRAKITFDGTQTVGLANWRVNSGSVGWLYAKSLMPNIKNASSTDDVPNIISDTLKTVKYGGSEGIYGCSIDCISLVWSSNDWGIAMRSTDMSLTTASAINAWLAQTPVTAVYELATPITYTLTQTEIRTLLGVNNIWADTGKINEVEYSANSQLCIANKLNELDSLLSTYTETQE